MKRQNLMFDKSLSGLGSEADQKSTKGKNATQTDKKPQAFRM